MGYRVTRIVAGQYENDVAHVWGRRKTPDGVLDHGIFVRSRAGMFGSRTVGNCVVTGNHTVLLSGGAASVLGRGGPVDPIHETSPVFVVVADSADLDHQTQKMVGSGRLCCQCCTVQRGCFNSRSGNLFSIPRHGALGYDSIRIYSCVKWRDTADLFQKLLLGAILTNGSGDGLGYSLFLAKSAHMELARTRTCAAGDVSLDCAVRLDNGRDNCVTRNFAGLTMDSLEKRGVKAEIPAHSRIICVPECASAPDSTCENTVRDGNLLLEQYRMGRLVLVWPKFWQERSGTT